MLKRRLIAGASCSFQNSVTPRVDLNDMITDGDEPTIQPPKPDLQAYAEKRTIVLDDWQNIRDAMQKSYIESLVPGHVCSRCKNGITGHRITCDDCSPGTVFCQGCCEDIHSVVRFHIPLIWPVSVDLTINMMFAKR